MAFGCERSGVRGVESSLKSGASSAQLDASISRRRASSRCPELARGHATRFGAVVAARDVFANRARVETASSISHSTSRFSVLRRLRAPPLFGTSRGVAPLVPKQFLARGAGFQLMSTRAASLSLEQSLSLIVWPLTHAPRRQGSPIMSKRRAAPATCTSGTLLGRTGRFRAGSWYQRSRPACGRSTCALGTGAAVSEA